LKLYIMRHGPAEDRADSGMDSDRALSAGGRERVRAVAKFLLEIGEEPLLVVTSPLVRAVQTAEIVAIGTKLGDRDGKVDVRRELTPGGTGCDGLVASLAAMSARRVLLVGHEPDVSELTQSLLAKASSKGLPHQFDKAMVVALHIGPDGRASRLRFVLEPRTLRLDPDLRGSGL
jgi:phosphohistidine phosphatase